MKNSKKVVSKISKSFDNKAVKLDKIKGGNADLIITVDDDLT